MIQGIHVEKKNIYIYIYVYIYVYIYIYIYIEREREREQARVVGKREERQTHGEKKYIYHILQNSLDLFFKI